MTGQEDLSVSLNNKQKVLKCPPCSILTISHISTNNKKIGFGLLKNVQYGISRPLDKSGYSIVGHTVATI